VILGRIRTLGLVIMALPFVEALRIIRGPVPAVAAARSRGQRSRLRSAAERRALGRIIRKVDSVLPPGPNCYRRVLLEVALDRQAAAEPVFLGFRSPIGPASGHAWLGADPEGATFKAVIQV
jgi:hypothetical protein